MNFVSSVQCCERDGERKIVYFKMMEIKNKKAKKHEWKERKDHECCTFIG